MNLKSKVILILTLLFSVNTFSQVGIGTDNPNPDAILDIVSSDKGILAPRVSLTAKNAPNPLSAHVAGMMVYNEVSAGAAPNNVIPGFYYNNGAGWVRMADSGFTVADVDLRNIGNNSHATLDAGSLNGTSLGAGADNIAIGSESFQGITQGSSNVVIGSNALKEGGNVTTVSGVTSRTAIESTVIGKGAGEGFSNSWSTLIGFEAGKGASGQTLIGIGHQAALNGGKSLEAVAIGYLALANQGDNMTTFNDIAIGNRALQDYAPEVDPIEASNGKNIAIGTQALRMSKGHYNIGIGEFSLMNAGGKAVSNTALGFQAGRNSNGRRNIFIGETAGNNAIITGNDNLLLGKNTAVQDLAGNGQINILNRIIGDTDGDIGIGGSPHPSSVLDIKSSNKGLLIPSISLTSTNGFNPIQTTPVDGLIVYNNATSGTAPNNVTPGYYYWQGSSWRRVATGAAAVVADATTTSKGVIQLSGSLSGTAASPLLADGAVTQNKIASSAVGNGLQLSNGKIEIIDEVDPSIRDQAHNQDLSVLPVADRFFQIFDPTTESNSVFEVVLFLEDDNCGFSAVLNTVVSAYEFSNPSSTSLTNFPTLDIISGTHNFGNANPLNITATDDDFIIDNTISFFNFKRRYNSTPTNLSAVNKVNTEMKVDFVMGGACPTTNSNTADFVLQIDGSDGKLKFLNVQSGNALRAQARVRRIF